MRCCRTMRLADVTALSELAKKKGILHVCDATFATPAMMQPIKLGADVCIVSTTKFYCGHNMTVCTVWRERARERVGCACALLLFQLGRNQGET